MESDSVGSTPESRTQTNFRGPAISGEEEQKMLLKVLESIACLTSEMTSIRQRVDNLVVLPGSAETRSISNHTFPITPVNSENSQTMGLNTGNFADILRDRRRDTFATRMAQPASTLITPTVHRELPDYSRIRLKVFSVAAAFAFFEDIDAYKRVNRHPVPAAALVADSVRDQIIVANGYILSEYAFNDLSNEELYCAVQRALRPRTPFEFLASIQDAVKFPSLPSGYKPQAHDFEAMYSALATFVRRFAFCFEFLAEHNASNIPRCDNRDGGLIKAFVDMIPFDFARNVVFSLKTTKFESFSDFKDAFMGTVNEIYNIFLRGKSQSQYFRDSPQTASRQSSVNVSEKSPATTQRFTPFRSSFRNISELEHSPEVSWDAGCEPIPPTVDDVRFEDTAQLSAISNEIQVCRKQLIGACTLPPGQCRYSHDPVQLRAFCAREVAKLTSSQYYVPPTRQNHTVQSPSALARPSPGASAQGSSASRTLVTSKLAGLESVDDDELELEYLDGQLSMMTRSVLSTLGVPQQQGLARHVANVSFGPDVLDTVQVLFDTGANDSSYILGSWVDEHRSQLQKAGAISPCNVLVTLADESRVVRVREICELMLSMVYEGVVYEATVPCRVMNNLSTTLVLGLPEISGPFLHLHISKLLSASKQQPPQTLERALRLLEPWSSQSDPSLLESAVEEAPLPVTFGEALHFLGASREAAEAEYLALIEQQVSSEMRAATDVETLLRTKGKLVFVPQNWDGISGILPIEFEWATTLPRRFIPKVRGINPKLLAQAKTEFDRLTTYHFVPSQSPIASNIVVAPKATHPFIRLCGDYSWVNKHIIAGASIIPDVRKQLDRICGFSVFVDLDLSNAFHQLRLGPITSERLSLVTMWGQVRPVFLPEGVTPASAMLQEVVAGVFRDFMDFMIVIFDNLLLLALSMEDAYNKLEKVLDRCIERNVFLKFSKSFIGFREVHFFGYICKHLSFGLSEKRKAAILDIPMPTSTKAMQRFLGAANFFRSFIPNFSDLTAPLHDMVKVGFQWMQRPWDIDYEAIFVDFKRALLGACELFYPNYELDWVLRVDASDRGVGAVLFQVAVSPDGSHIHQPLVFASKKLSDVAQRWTVYEKEAYAMYFGVLSSEYYLRAKPFTLETDHNNLVWMEASLVPKVIRWRIYLQAFRFLVRHIPGALNSVADWQSRLYSIAALTCSRQEALELSHVGRAGHMGVKRTWGVLNKTFPGHGISLAVVADFVASCVTCQKVRLYMGEVIEPVPRHLKQDTIRSMVGIDTLTLPLDANGNRYLHVFRNLFSKLVTMYPVPTHDADSLARSIFSYYTTYGLHDGIISDPGSDLTSTVVATLTSWLGIHHRFSLVGRHESSGVEAANRQILRYMRAIFSDERVSKRWSDISIVGWVTFIMNTYDIEETGYSPYVITFGSESKPYFKAPTGGDVRGYVAALNNDLATVRQLVREYQNLLKPELPQAQNVYQPGDFVLLHKTVEYVPRSKLHPKYLGPYRVIRQIKNDVEVEHLITGRLYVFYVADLRIFVGDANAAHSAAMLDDEQFPIDHILTYKGDPAVRTSLEFLVLFQDGSKIWLPWSEDLSSTAQYESYCLSVSHLRQLRYTTAQIGTINAEINRSPITEVAVGDTVYVDLRSYGHIWFDALDLPQAATHAYVLEYVYVKASRSKRFFWAECKVFKELWRLNHVFVLDYGCVKEFDPRLMVLIDEPFIRLFPSVLSQILIIE